MKNRSQRREAIYCQSHYLGEPNHNCKKQRGKCQMFGCLATINVSHCLEKKCNSLNSVFLCHLRIEKTAYYLLPCSYNVMLFASHLQGQSSRCSGSLISLVVTESHVCYQLCWDVLDWTGF